ncbi:hypothetical protein NZ698_00400 [Chryseobacterium sp. PBS4-4]|uniref:Uncharacterized protein n=1 Tax=Chryseobacterium edaphi TaxID=2976532 RepID=A0ABT2W072_9FLAO|nr:hypothetical protein [Chryseobacterium edaphi]MCU7615640.1 hypothetical protein [Chryseobacterium edaphi]
MNPKEELKQLFADRKPIDVAIEINGYTGFRTTLIDELTEQEAMKLLSIHVPKEKSVEEENNALKHELLRNGWISKILKIAEETGIKEKGRFEKFNGWMYVSSKFKKHLNAHSIEELQEVHRQLHAVKTNNARSANRPMTKAWWDKAEKNVKLN